MKNRAMLAGRQGFTLIELVVAIGIVIGLVAVGVTSMSQFYSRDKVVSARNEVVSTIKMAKNYAVTDQSPAGYGSQLHAVEVILVNSKLSVVPATMISGNLNVGSSYFASVIKDDEIQLSWNDPVTNIIFSVPEGKLLNTDGAPKVSSYVKTISIRAAGAVGETLVVNISAMGVIGE